MRTPNDIRCELLNVTSAIELTQGEMHLRLISSDLCEDQLFRLRCREALLRQELEHAEMILGNEMQQAATRMNERIQLGGVGQDLIIDQAWYFGRLRWVRPMALRFLALFGVEVHHCPVCDRQTRWRSEDLVESAACESVDGGIVFATHAYGSFTCCRRCEVGVMFIPETGHTAIRSQDVIR